jgi:HEAT repeat protein
MVVLLPLVAGAVWYFLPELTNTTVEPVAAIEDSWVDHLYSVNPKEQAAATEWVTENPEDALAAVMAVFQDRESDRAEKRAALKACGLLGPAAATAIPHAATLFMSSDLIEEAGAALSLMGPDAFPPLRAALSSRNATVRREALRAIGKLTERAPLDRRTVVPILVERIGDRDASVGAVAATYLGILKSHAQESVPALIRGLEDAEPSVRLAAAIALEAFGHEAQPAVPALKKAVTDRNEDVAREAGRALVTISTVR